MSQLYTAYLDTQPFPANSMGIGTAQYLKWPNPAGMIIYIKGIWLWNGCGGVPMIPTDVWARLTILEDGTLIYPYGWDRYQEPAQASQGPVFFTPDWFVLPADATLQLEAGAQGYPWSQGYMARFQLVVYYTKGAP